ncbi:MAG: hypothetical protein ABEJ40_10165 [Haloarculaceae archaeon]
MTTEPTVPQYAAAPAEEYGVAASIPSLRDGAAGRSARVNRAFEPTVAA